MSKIVVKGTNITIVEHNETDYISLTDMTKSVDNGDRLVENWLRNKNTIEFLGLWEVLYNPNFNTLEFEGIKNSAGTNRFLMSVNQWTTKTNAIGMMTKPGRYGGTLAHKDIAFEFGAWISPEFKLLLIKEFQRLKDEESKSKNVEWDYRRFLSKANYRLHTDAIKENIIPNYTHLKSGQESFIYANEAEILNVAVFGTTSKQWRDENKEANKDGLNIRDLANTIQLTVLSNLESYNSILISKGVTPQDRLNELKNIAIGQLKSLSKENHQFSIESPNSHKYTKEVIKELPPPDKK
ncbi:MAG TPA: KilA-N domain-containing protein [Bacteroidia bacterium]|jgi:hypothetical protein|nr:KilA-N domain-containing protein [Bacteroidia bacterium]